LFVPLLIEAELALLTSIILYNAALGNNLAEAMARCADPGVFPHLASRPACRLAKRSSLER
jgi:hypothetical protein